MNALHVLLWLAVALYSWACLGCVIGVVRFKYWPLAILGTGYLCWVGSFLSLLLMPDPGSVRAPLGRIMLLLAAGAMLVFGYRFTFYPRMRARGIHPKNLFGFGAGPREAE